MNLSQETYIQIATLGKTHALSGMMNIYFDVEVHHSGFKVVFIEEKTGYSPYLVKQVNVHGEKGYIHFEDINSKEAAQVLVNKTVFVKSSQFDQFFKYVENDLFDLMGYTVYNGKEYIGEITEIFDNTAQLLAEIKKQDQVYLIPLIEEFIISVDDAKKKLVMELPEGLLNLS